MYHFKRKPKHEYLEFMFVRRGKDEFFIESFHKIRNVDTSEAYVDFDPMQYQALKNEAASLGFEHASIHTHTTCDSAPSVRDQMESYADGEALIGICEVDEDQGRLSTNVVFWLPNLPLKLNEIID